MYLHLSFTGGTVQPVITETLGSYADLMAFLFTDSPHWITDEKGVLWNLDQCIRVDIIPDFKKR